MKELKDLGLSPLDKGAISNVNGGIRTQQKLFIVCCIDIGVSPIKVGGRY